MTTSMNFDIGANDRASAVLLRIAAAAEKLERQLKEIDRVRATPKITLDAADAKRDAAEVRRDLAAIRNVSVKLKVGVTGGTAVTNIANRLRTLQDLNVRVDLNIGDAESKADRLATKMTALRALSPIKLRIEADDQATADLTAISAAATALARVSPTIRVDVASAAALAQLAAVAAALGALGTGSTTVRVQLDQLTFLGQLARIQTELRALSGGDVEINADTRGLMEELARVRGELADLSRQTPSVVIDADIALARHRIQQLEEELARIAGRQYRARVDVDVDKGALDRIASLGKGIVGLGAAGGLAAAGIGTATAAAATLAGSLASLAGGIPVLVGGLAAGGAAVAALKIGLSGVGDALKEADPTKYAESLRGLSPAAASFVTSIRSMKGAFDGLQLDVQQRLFAGFGAEAQKVGGTYLPVLRSGLGGIAGEFNQVGKSMTAFATSAATVRDVETIFRNTTAAMANARPAATNLLSAFRDIATVGTSMLPGLATGFTNATARFRDFIAQARETGQLEVWIRNAGQTLQQLGSIAGNVGGSLGAVFTAAKASGADFLTTLERVTQSIEDMLRSTQGQASLKAFFTDSRAAIDALLPGLKSLGDSALKFIQAFSETNALQVTGRAISDLAAAIAPLGAQLGELAGNTLRALASGAQAAAVALGPIVAAIGGILSALGPVTPAVLGMVLAFAGLAKVGAWVTAAGASLAALAGRAVGAAGPIGGIATAFTKAGAALPFLGVALVAVGVAFDLLGSKADENVQKVIQGSMTMSQAVAAELDRINANYLDIFGREASEQVRFHADAVKKVGEEFQAAYQKLGPYAQRQADVAIAQAELNDAVARFGEDSQQATDAGNRLATANDRLKAAQDGAKQAAMSHTEAIKAQAEAMNSQINAALAYEDAVRRTAEAHKAAAEALKATGKDSAEYQQAVSDLTRAISSQADAARKQAEAWGGTEAGVKAYNTEILKAADLSTQAGRDAFGKLAGALDNAGLAALSAQAQMSGLRTEIMTLPDGRKVTVVVAADQKQLDTVKQSVQEIAGKEFIGTVRINGNADEFKGVIAQSVTLANDTKAVIRTYADGREAEITIEGLKYKIDATTGTLKIQGDPGPGQASLDGLKLKTDTTTGTMTIEADNAPANQKLDYTITTANGSTGTITVDGNPTTANNKTTAAVRLADGSTGTITIEGNQTPANGKINATIRFADGSTGTVKINANDAAALAAIERLKQPTSSTHTIRVVQTQTGPQYQSGGTTVLGAQGMIVRPMATGGVIGMAGGGQLTPMSSKVATFVRPNTWRVIGDRVTDDEAFIPINQSARSMAILHATAGRMGQQVAPMASGGLMDTSSTLWRQMPSYASSSGSTTQFATAVAPLRKEIRDLTTRLLEVLRTQRPITVEDRSGDPVQTARATQLAIRTS